MALPGMGWLSDLLGWDEEEQAATPPQDIEAMRAQQYARQWRQAVAPSTATAGPQPQSDPLQTALQQWQAGNGQPTAPARPMQGPLRPGEQRPMVPPVGPQIAPPTAPVDQPAANPWLAAVDAWRQGPPQQPAYNPLSSANTGQAPKPTTDISSLITYDVKPTLPQIGTGYDQPNTGVGQFSAQQTQAPTVGSQIKPMQGPQPYNPSDWLSRQIGNWQKPIGEAANEAGGFINDYARNVGQIGPLDATRELFAGTAGYDKAMLDFEARQKTPGWNGLLDNPVVDNLMTGLDAAFTIPGKAIETTQLPGTGALLGGPNVSAGQLASATGEMINKTLNPFNPNQVDLSYLDLAKDLINGGPNVARSLFWDNLRQSQAVRTAFDALPEEMRTQANAAMVKLIAGPEETKSAIDAVLNQDGMVADLEQKAQQAQAQGDAQAAAQFGAQANELKNKSKSELIDEHGNAWAEFLGGVIFDPSNLIGIGGGQEAIQAAKSSALMNLTPEAALKALDGVLDNATKAATGGNVSNWWNAVNPFARTADTQAAMATDTLWRAAANMMADVTDKASAKAVVDMWTGDPRQLVEGVVLPGSTEISKWGPGVVANQELLKQYPVLVKAREAMLNMRSLAGDPATFSPTEFFAELNDVLYKSSRELFGLKTLDELPAGAVNFRTVKTANGTSVIEYVDKAGKVLKQTAEMLPYDAELQAKQLRSAIKAVGPGGQNPLAATWGVQKAILSDMYLGMSPGYWIKNATSAAATMLTDNTMTLLPTNQILNDFMTKFGGVVPTTRSAEAAGNALGQAAGEALGGMHWSEKLFGKDNPYAKMMNKLYSIPFGATDIAGRIPFGEQNFALRATYVPFKRYLTSQWGDAAKGFEQTLSALGIDPNLAKSLANTVADVGVNGNKAQMQQVMKKLTTAQVVPFSLKELGVPDELVSAEGWAKLNTVLSESLPNQLEEAAAKVSEIFGQEFKAAGQLLNSAPPQPGRYVWTEFESVQDGADVVDSMVDAAKRAGLPADQMRQEAQGLMKQIADTESALWTTLRQDLAGATDSSSLNVAMDLMAKWYDWRTTARAQVDALSKQAISTNTADAWAKKFEGTRQIYGGFTDFFQKATDEARQNLIKLESGGQVDGGYDWWNVIKRYASYDEAEVRAARTAGMGVGSPQGQGDVFTKALDANRKYVDKSVVELFSAFRQYPSQTTLDLMSDGMRKMEELGAKAAGFLADKRTTMLPKNADAYYKLRNQVWAEFFDNSVVHNNVVKRLVVASGVADMAKGALKWSDEFSGGEFQLVGKLADNFWQARNTATGELVRFADPVALQQAKNANQVVVSSLPTVPLNTVQDFYRVIGENTNIVDKLIEELNTTAAAAVAKREAQLEAELARLMAEDVTVPTMRLVAPADEIARQAAMQTDQAKEIAAGSNEARLALRDEWDRVAKATGGYPKLDQLIATYTREGIVNVPENLFEDLYGQTIAGRTLGNQADVERFLQEYYDLGQQAKNALFKPTPTETDFGAGIGQAFGKIIDALAGGRSNNPYTVAPTASGWNPWGIAEAAKQTDLYKLVSGINGNLADLLGKKAPEIGEMAQHTIRTLTDAERKIMQRLPEILAGKQNTMTPAQQLRVLDALNEMMPQYDNVLAGAVRTGEQMANYAMLNYNDKRNIDVWAAALMPYHYFWSRSAKNWMERAIQKPGVVNMYYESQRAIEMENEQNNVPEHLRGTIQNPLKQVMGVGPDRLLNPLQFMLPFAMYLGSDFVNPDDARSDMERWMMTIKKYTPAMYPIADYATKAMLDQTTPLPGGKRRTDEFQLGDVLPLYKMAGYGYQAATGDMSMSQGPLGYGDEYDYGRAGKQVGLAAMRQDVTSDQAKWGLDVGFQQANQQGPLPEQPAGSEQVWQQGVQAAGWDRLQNRAMAFLTGVPGYNLSPEEQQMRDMKSERANLGYEQGANPWGSQAAVAGFDEQSGGILGPTFAYSQLYPQEQKPPAPNAPGYEASFVPKRPGVSAVDEAKKAEKEAIYAEMNQAVEQFIAQNPNAKNKDLYAIKQPFYDQANALNEKYPSATQYDNPFPISFNQGPGVNPTSGPQLPDFYGNMNPAELQQAATDNALRQAQGELSDMKPTAPGEGATAAQWQQYYASKTAYDNAVAGRVDEITSNPDLMSQLVGGRPITPTTFPDGTTGQLPGIPSGQDVMTEAQYKNMTPAERAFRERNAAQQAERNLPDWAGNGQQTGGQGNYSNRPPRQNFTQARAGVQGYFGPGGAKMFDEYYALPKGAAREEYLKNNPVMRAINLYAYNSKELQPALQMFGDDALGKWALTPAYADTPEAKAARNAYYDKNPVAFEFGAWLNGRPANRKEGETEGAEGFKYNFGADHAQAKELFGENIWEVVSQFKRSWNGTQKRMWYEKHPEYLAWQSWWYGSEQREYKSGGGAGGYAPFGGYNKQERKTQVRIQDVYGQGMSGGLGEPARVAGYQNPSMDWMRQGQELKPGRQVREWTPDWIRGIKK